MLFKICPFILHSYAVFPIRRKSFDPTIVRDHISIRFLLIWKRIVFLFLYIYIWNEFGYFSGDDFIRKHRFLQDFSDENKTCLRRKPPSIRANIPSYILCSSKYFHCLRRKRRPKSGSNMNYSVSYMRLFEFVLKVAHKSKQNLQKHIPFMKLSFAKQNTQVHIK